MPTPSPDRSSRTPDQALPGFQSESVTMIMITGALRLPPDKVEEARPHMRVLIETPREEPGCLLYAWAEDLLEPGLIRMIEHWQDWPSFVAHDQSPHAARWKAALAT